MQVRDADNEVPVVEAKAGVGREPELVARQTDPLGKGLLQRGDHCRRGDNSWHGVYSVLVIGARDLTVRPGQQPHPGQLADRVVDEVDAAIREAAVHAARV